MMGQLGEGQGIVHILQGEMSSFWVELHRSIHFSSCINPDVPIGLFVFNVILTFLASARENPTLSHYPSSFASPSPFPASFLSIKTPEGITYSHGLHLLTFQLHILVSLSPITKPQIPSLLNERTPPNFCSQSSLCSG